MPTVLSDVATLRRAIEYAVRAPSVYNSQPWRWRVDANGVDLFADPDRHLLAIDPDGRDLLLSCGAALHHLVVGLAGLGVGARVDRFPDPENSDHLAHVTPVDSSPAPDEVQLAPAIPRRHTDRRRFAAHPVDDALLDVLVRRATDCGANLHVVAGDARIQLMGLITASATLQRQQAGYAAELARWTGRYAAARDGIRSDTVAAGIGRPGEVPMRPFPRASLAQSPHSFEHEDASVLMVLCSGTDDRLGALRAGEAVSAVLLTATDLGLATTPLSQPLEVTDTRAAVSAHIVGPQLFPQIVLRVGWAQPASPDLAPTQRRNLDHVLRTV
ncbi:Acg family FMN-binding oxidoreductase [Pseudonocardia saturnea]